MSYVHPEWLKHQQRRFLRHDAHRFEKPEPIQRKTYAERMIEQRQAEEEEAIAEAEQGAFEREVLRLRREWAEIKFEFEWRRFSEKYDPNQPRVPKGNSDGGQWAKEGAGGAGKDPGADNIDDAQADSSGLVLSDESPDPVEPGAQYAQSRIEIDPQVLTGKETIDRTTVALTKRLANVVDALEVLPVQSGAAYGRLVHETLKLSLRLFPVPGVKVEPTLGGAGYYGSAGSARPDVSLENEVGDTLAYYDYKTGGARVKTSYADRVRSLGGVLVPVIQLSVTSGSRIKSWTRSRFDR